MKIKNLTEKDKGSLVVYKGYKVGRLIGWNDKVVILNFRKCSPIMVHIDPKYVEFK